MAKPLVRAYSRYSGDAVSLLGSLVRAARKQRRLTTQEVANRAGVSRGLVQRIEKGDMKCQIGAVFEVAAIVGVRLFDADEAALARYIHHTQHTLTLLPKAVRKTTAVLDDDF